MGFNSGFKELIVSWCEECGWIYAVTFSSLFQE